MSHNRFMQVVQRVLALQPTGLHDRQDALHKATTRGAPTAETPLPPQYCAAQQPLHEGPVKTEPESWLKPADALARVQTAVGNRGVAINTILGRLKAGLTRCSHMGASWENIS